jgi:hypothetical protein
LGKPRASVSHLAEVEPIEFIWAYSFASEEMESIGASKVTSKETGFFLLAEKIIVVKRVQLKGRL